MRIEFWVDDGSIIDIFQDFKLKIKLIEQVASKRSDKVSRFFRNKQSLLLVKWDKYHVLLSNV
jgi:hypothetical protein